MINLTILKDNTVEDNIQIKDVLESLSKIMDNFILRTGEDGVLDSGAHICAGVSCMRCPFIDEITKCGKKVLPKKYRLSHLKQIYQYIQNGYKEPYSVDVNEVL